MSHACGTSKPCQSAKTSGLVYIYIYIYIYIYRESVSRFSRGTVLNTLKQSGINILRGKKDATTFPDKPVSGIASLFRGFKTPEE